MLPISMLPPEVHTARLVLRRQHPDDAHLVKEAIDSSLAHLKASVAWAQSAPFPLATLSSRLGGGGCGIRCGASVGIFHLRSSTNSHPRRRRARTRRRRADGAGRPERCGDRVLVAGRCDGERLCDGSDQPSHVARPHAPRRAAVVVCHDPVNAASEGVPRRLGFRCLGTVSSAVLPGRQAADGSLRATTRVWVFDASETGEASSGSLTPLFQNTF